ncbi:MAG: serine hydrolase [Acidobacteriota bacterium]
MTRLVQLLSIFLPSLLVTLWSMGGIGAQLEMQKASPVGESGRTPQRLAGFGPEIIGTPVKLVPSSSSNVQTELKNWIEVSIPEYMRRSRMPGFSIAVVKDGETVYAEGFGARDPKRNLPATTNTLYGIGSITKSFVAIGIMQLVEGGKIRLEDPVSKHIPFKVGLAGKPITVHHLLTHSLGIPSLASSSVALRRGLGVDTGVPFGSAGDFYRFVNGARNEIVAEPGERFFYHNAGWRMLGHIIQEKSRLPFHKYLKQRVIDPLGMKRTTLNISDFSADPDHIVPHRRKSEGSVEAASFPYPDPDDNVGFSFLVAAGGVVSSVNEMTKYLNAQIEKGRYPGGRLATKDSFEKMQMLHIRTTDGYYGRNGYGYGLRIYPDFLGYKLISHGGSIIVSTAHMAFIPEIKAGVIMMGNSSGMPYQTIAQSILAIMLGKDPEEALPPLKIKNRMEKLAGEYAAYRGLQKATVIEAGGMLYLETHSPFDGSRSRVALIPDDPTLDSTQFYTLRNGLRSPVEFAIQDDGAIDLFVGRYCYHKVN